MHRFVPSNPAAPHAACPACAVRRSLQEREVEKEREEKKLQVEEMERMKTWEKGREVRVDSWKGFKGDEKSRTVVSGRRDTRGLAMRFL